MARLRSLVAAAGERPTLVVGTIFAVAAAALASFTTQMTDFQPDEMLYTSMAREMADSLSPLSREIGRDWYSQLYPLTLSPLYLLWGNVTAYEVAHAWNAVLVASTSIPTYMLTRAVAPASRWPAYLAALLVVVAPWVTMSSVQLTEVAAYPATVWALLAMQRALVERGAKRDLIAFAVLALAAFARLQLIVLLPVFLLALILHEVLFSVREVGAVRAGLRGSWGALRRGHPLALAVAAFGVVVGVPLLMSGVLAARLGGYGSTVSGDLLPPGIWDQARTNVTALALGLGAIPAAIAVGGWIDAVGWGRDRRVHAFALISALSFVAIVLQVASVNVRFIDSLVQERYTMFLGPVLIVGMVTGIATARRPAAAVLVGTALLVGLIATTDYETQRTSFQYLTSPGITTFVDVIAPRLGWLSASFGWPDASRFLLMAFVMVGLALAAAALLRRLKRPAALALFGGALLVFCVPVTYHAFDRLLYGSETGRGLAAGSTRNADWIDQTVPEGQRASLLARQSGQSADARAVWWGVEFWNRAIESVYALGGPAYTWSPARAVRLQHTSGRVVTDGPPSRYIVTAANGVPFAPDGRTLRNSPRGGLALVLVDGALRVRWGVEGLSDDGWLPMHGRATLYVYPDGAQRCRQLELTAATPRGVSGPRRLVVTGSKVNTSVRVAPGETRKVAVPACSGDNRSAARFRVRSRVAEGDPNPAVTMRLVAIRQLPT